MPERSRSHNMLLFAVWLLAGIQMDLFRYCTGMQIQECNQGSFEAVENTVHSLTCTGHSGTVTWKFKQKTENARDIGTCSSTCQVSQTLPANFFTLTPLSASSSRLDLSTAVTTKQNIDVIFLCGSIQCSLTIVVNAELGALTVNLSKPDTGNGWTVSGTVPITKVFSSNRQYRCVWSRRHGSGQYTGVTTKYLFTEPNPNYEDKSGTCDFTDSLPDTTGNYTYRVQVYPGATEKTDSSVVIASPPPPSISCTPNTRYVSEDTDVSCTCSGSVGRPAGRLVWVRQNNNVDITVKEGGYGNDSLQLTMTVNRSHDGNKLRCDVDWVTDTTGPAYTVSVAYGPDSAAFVPESPVFYTDSTGSHSLTLTCKPRDVNPTTGLTYRWTGRCAGVTSDRCSFRPRPPDESGDGDVDAAVQCQVTNPVNNKMEQASFVLQLKYPPRLAPHIQGYTDNQILYQGDPLNINCTVAGGEPNVSSVTLTCTGHSQRPQNGQSSSLSVTSLIAGDHGAVCTCSATWTKPEYYTLTATRTLTVYYTASDVTFGIDGNKNLTINESDRVTFDCQSRGRPTPELQLTQSDTVLQRAEGGKLSLAEVITRLSHTITAQCDNTGLYTCSAHNEVGDTQRVTAQLYVNCSPRLQDPAPTDPPKLNYEGHPVHLYVHIVAFPLPETFHFVFHGPGNNVSKSVTPGNLESRCWTTFAAYAVICNVTVNVITSGEAGFYSLRIGKRVDYSSIKFEVKYFESDPQAGKCSSGGLSAGAAVGLTLALVFVVVGVVVVWMWRRHWVLPCINVSSSGNVRNIIECNQLSASPPEPVEHAEHLHTSFNEVPDDNHRTSNNYESLQSQDIGLVSDYAELSHYVIARETSANGAGPVKKRPSDKIYQNVEKISLT